MSGTFSDEAWGQCVEWLSVDKAIASKINDLAKTSNETVLALESVNLSR